MMDIQNARDILVNILIVLGIILILMSIRVLMEIRKMLKMIREEAENEQ